MTVSKVCFNLALIILVICVQEFKSMKYPKHDYVFGRYKENDEPILIEANATASRHAWHHENVLTFLVPIPSKKIKERFKEKFKQNPRYIPKISQIIVSDQGTSSEDCDITSGGMGHTFVTLKFINHNHRSIKYFVTLYGQ